MSLQKCSTAPGMVIERWTILAILPSRIHSGKRRGFLLCQCSCGTVREVMHTSLATGQSKSCGCLTREKARGIGQRSRTHGETRTSRLYRLWNGMNRRCHVPGDTTNYRKYGDRGIVVCPEWRHDYLAFKAWALQNGYSDDLQIDRIDSLSNYSPDNCRWVTSKENQRNRTNNAWIEAFGEKKLQTDWAKDPRCFVSEAAICRRLKEGWPPELAIGSPPRKPRTAPTRNA